jgi:hypothetical protein
MSDTITRPPGSGRATLLAGTSRRVQVIALAVLLALGGLVVHNLLASSAADPVVPTSAAMENVLGVRFSRVAVVGDGGLVEVSYLVLDSEKATRFQSRTADPPVLTNLGSGRTTKRVSLMKQGHQLRNGQTYYLVYLNSGVLKPGDRAEITSQHQTLTGVPVL